MINTPTLIIGAGPAGLAVAGRLQKLQLPFEIIERTDKVASAWHQHYDRLCLHTVKELSHLPHLEFPEHYPRYVPREQLVEYFQNYCQHFDIQPRFKTAAKSVQKVANHWKVTTSSGEDFLAENIVVASGVNRVPNAPTWKGMETFKGEIIHSRNYKNPNPFQGQKVLVIGMGNTGAEVALDLSEHDIEVYISVRSPITIVPRDINGRPVQVTAKTLAKIPFGLGDWLGTQIRRVVIGDLSKYGVPLSKVHPAVQLRETGKTPVIDLGTVDHIKQERIKVLPDIASFYESGVVLKNGELHEFDSIILATGYRAQIEDFIEDTSDLMNQDNIPKTAISSKEGLYFVGFDNYKLGGILGTIFSDSERVAKHIQARLSVKS